MNRADLISEIYLTGTDTEASVVIKFPSGLFALVKEVINLNGEVVIVATFDAREAYSDNG